jgi:hypothetical protein
MVDTPLSNSGAHKALGFESPIGHMYKLVLKVAVALLLVLVTAPSAHALTDHDKVFVAAVRNEFPYLGVPNKAIVRQAVSTCVILRENSGSYEAGARYEATMSTVASLKLGWMDSYRFLAYVTQFYCPRFNY